MYTNQFLTKGNLLCLRLLSFYMLTYKLVLASTLNTLLLALPYSTAGANWFRCVFSDHKCSRKAPLPILLTKLLKTMNYHTTRDYKLLYEMFMVITELWNARSLACPAYPIQKQTQVALLRKLNQGIHISWMRLLSYNHQRCTTPKPND